MSLDMTMYLIIDMKLSMCDYVYGDLCLCVSLCASWYVGSILGCTSDSSPLGPPSLVPLPLPFFCQQSKEITSYREPFPSLPETTWNLP